MKIIWQNKPNHYDGSITYRVIPSPLGKLFVAQTERGICQLSFVIKGRSGEPLELLRQRWPKANLQAGNISGISSPARLDRWLSKKTFHLSATPFQQQVWKLLLKIPRGATTSYGALATRARRPKAQRAVGSAVGANPIAVLIPCHRVLGADGKLGNYHWGAAVKQKLLAREGVQLAQ